MFRGSKEKPLFIGNRLENRLSVVNPHFPDGTPIMIFFASLSLYEVNVEELKVRYFYPLTYRWHLGDKQLQKWMIVRWYRSWGGKD
ncbi:hypothetical protein D8Z77_22340 [Brevibacillus laterosporus]|nr:hypothetical protein D8Z77_22340 [Brevibacillus laterosporus]